MVEFRPHPDAPEYLVGTDGTVIGKLGRKLKPGRNAGSLFVVVKLSCGRWRSTQVHRLVLETFVGKRPAGMECRHLDGDFTNNHLSNLCWGSPKDNAEDRRQHGTQVWGDKCGSSKLTKDQALEVLSRLSAGETQRSIAKSYGLDPSAISNIKRRRNWSRLHRQEVI